MTISSTPPSTNNLLGIADPDAPIYRMFPLKYIRQALSEHKLALVSPSVWPDPFENLVVMTGITYTGERPYRQEFFDKTRRQVFAQCWSRTAESDAMWRIYSRVEKDLATNRNTCSNAEGVRVRTTSRKLLGALWGWCPTAPVEDCCFLGRVQYSSDQQVLQELANIVGREGIAAFAGGRGHATALLSKRDAFAHEQEIRLVYVEPDDVATVGRLRFMTIDPEAVFEELTCDPRLAAADVAERTAEFRALGYAGTVNKSQLYQRVLLEVHL
jgi:hypothetical protein